MEIVALTSSAACVMQEMQLKDFYHSLQEKMEREQDTLCLAALIFPGVAIVCDTSKS